MAEITRGRGQQFDPGVVDAFLGISEEEAVDLGRGSVTTATENPGQKQQAYEIPDGFRLWARVSRNRPEVAPKLQVAR
ncbi:MAG TPA: hypothetical protein VI411_10385, partial [Actinomycetota bacterium]